MKKVIAFLSTLTLSSTSILSVTACNNQQNQEVKVGFELISKIEIQKTYNNKFGIRFYKENTTVKGDIPNNFWYLTDEGKYVAEFDNIDSSIWKNITDILKIKDSDYYPDFTLIKGWNLKNISLSYKNNNNQKQLMNLNANLVADISILLRGTSTSINENIDQEWIDNEGHFTEKWWNFVKNNQDLNIKISNFFVKEVKKQINLEINNSDFDWQIWRAPSNIRTDVNKNVISFIISIDVTGKNQLMNQYSYDITISNNS